MRAMRKHYTISQRALRGRAKQGICVPPNSSSIHPGHEKMCYNTSMPVKVTFRKELSAEEKKLAECARAASRDAVKAAFAAGLSITVAKGRKIVEIAPDGAEKVIGSF